jgi:peptide/nickel transport system permease protein
VELRKYVLKRLLLAIPTLIGVSLLVFSMVHLIPGDPAEVMLYPKGTEEQIEQLRSKMGLDLPIYEQYLRWAINAVQFDLGKSIQSGEQVLEEIGGRFPATIELAAAALLIAVVVGIPLGVIAAQKRNTFIDYFTISLSLVGVSIPVFWLGLMMIFLFAANLGWLPVSGRIMMGMAPVEVTGFYLIDTLLAGDMEGFINAAKHLVLPAVALSTIPLALVVRITRSSMLDVLSQDYMRTARATGVRYRRRIFRHALKNALIPVVTVIGLQMGILLGGAILTESVFSWPGLGMLIVDAITDRDYPLIQGLVLIIAFIFVLVNILVDIMYSIIDPRIRYS